MSGTPAPPSCPVPSAEELARLCEFIRRRSGIAYGEARRAYVERRLVQGLRRTGAPSVAAYLAVLRSDPAEADRLIGSFTVKETYFYREDYQFRCLGRAILPEIVARRGPGDRVRLWSIPCSTGEEPYSIAIWLLENWAMVDAYNIEILGSDLDGQAVAAAGGGGGRGRPPPPGVGIRPSRCPLPRASLSCPSSGRWGWPGGPGDS